MLGFLLLAAALPALHALGSLSPLIASGQDVRAVSKVGPIAGITATSYAGLITTNASANAEAFFWYWPALSGNASAPVLLWLQGGPGSSSLFGAFVEIGPYRVTAAGLPTPNAFSWCNEYNVVFLDNPRGTGYSSADVLCESWECYGADTDSFVRQFLQAYGLEGNDFAYAGESYGGHYVTASAYTTHVNNAAGVAPKVNLKGVAIGNGFVAPLEMSAGYADIIYQAGLLSLPEYAVAQSYVANITSKIQEEDFVGAYYIWDAFLNGDSTPGGAWFTNVTGLTNYFNIAIETPAAFNFFVPFVTSQEVRGALGIGARPYLDGNLQVELALKGDVMYSQKPNLEALLAGGYKVLLYNGALDLICGAPLTERYVPLLAWPGQAGWNASPKAIWHDPSQAGAVSGYSRSYQTLNHVIMRGAGHMAVSVRGGGGLAGSAKLCDSRATTPHTTKHCALPDWQPFDQPARSLDLITRFVEGRAFD